MTIVWDASMMGRREITASFYSGFGGIALGMCSTFEIDAVESDVHTVCEVLDTITVIKI